MTVKELKEQLSKFAEDVEILLASDEEGNSYHTLDEVGLAQCHVGQYEIDVVHPDDIEEDVEYEVMAVFWP